MYVRQNPNVPSRESSSCKFRGAGHCCSASTFEVVIDKPDESIVCPRNSMDVRKCKIAWATISISIDFCPGIVDLSSPWHPAE